MLPRGKPFPWTSALSLLYPIAAAAYMSEQTYASLPAVVGYGLVNLTLVLVVAGVFAGTFQVFRISRAWQVFALAVVAFLGGTMLSNVGS